MPIPQPHAWKVGEEAGTPLGPGLVIGIAVPRDHEWFFAGQRWSRGPYIVKIHNGNVIGFEHDSLRVTGRWLTSGAL